MGSPGCLELLRAHAPQLRTLEPILDFGCGCGRVMRHLWAAEPGLSVWGKAEFKKALVLRSQIRRAGWFN